MLKKEIKYIDYDGNERKEIHHFNLSEAELAEMQLSTEGDFQSQIQETVDANNKTKIFSIFKDLILKSYGVKSADGKRFTKNPEVLAEFMETEAYSKLFMELVSDYDAAQAFIRGVLPPEISAKLDEVPLSGEVIDA